MPLLTIHNSQSGLARILLQQTLYMIECGLILFLFLFTACFKLTWDRAILGIGLGRGISSSVHLATWAVMANGGLPHSRHLLDFLNYGTYHLCVLIWFYYLLGPQKSATTSAVLPAREQSRHLEPGTGAFATTMNLAIIVIIVIAAALALGIILRVAVTQSLQAKQNTGLAVAIRPLDVEAFRNLIDPAEDDYLRRRLPPAQFRMVRRKRLRAMAAYIQVAGSNAAVLIRVGEAALTGGNVHTAVAAQQMVNDALLLRRNTAVALARIYLALAWPNSGFAAVRVVERYERLSGAAMLLGRLQNPAVPVRLSVPL